jgi:membrane protein DedA with SNARE-associated domain
MNEIVNFVERHGYSFLFAAVFVRQIGLPVPGFLCLLAAGALAAAGKLLLVAAIALGVSACVLADWIWYEAGRWGGDRVLHFLHQFTRDPEYHDRKAKRIFARHGLALLLVAKFMPGLDAIAPPLAGASCTSRLWFLTFDAAGAGIYACVYGGLGYVFSHDLDRAAAYVSQAGRWLLSLALVAVAIYVARNVTRRTRTDRGSRSVQVTTADPYECGYAVNCPVASLEDKRNGE